MVRQLNLEKQILKLPKKVLWCKKCVMSNQRPRIIFDEYGICSGCRNSEKKEKIDWNLREKKLKALLKQHKSKNNNFDVIVPSSGGKDSVYVAHMLKYKYGMKPLTVTWSPLQYTKIGTRNFYKKINNGFSNLLFTPNGKVHKLLARLSLEELGDAFHVFVLGQISYAFHIAKMMNIKLVFFGENGELEYAADPKGIDRPFKPVEEWSDQHFKGSTLKELLNKGLEVKDYLKKNKEEILNEDLSFYEPLSIDEMSSSGIEGKYFFSYYQKWNPQENYYYAAKYFDFEANSERSEGTYSKYASLDDRMDGFHYYMRYIKFGLGRCVEDASHEIRDKNINREEGLLLARKFDGNFPNKYFNDFLSYLNINHTEFTEIEDSWRLDHIWKKEGNQWKLKKPLE